MELRRGAHLPFPGHWARRWIYHWICDAWPVRRQVRLPSQPTGRYQFILLGEQRHIVCEQLAQSRYVKRSGRDSNLRPLGCKSDTVTITPPRHTFTEVGLKFKILYPGPWPRPSLQVFCHSWDVTNPDLSLYIIWNAWLHSLQRCGGSRVQFLDEQMGVPNAWISVVFYPTSTKSGST